MKYLVKTLRLGKKLEDIENNDKELTLNLNAFADKGYNLDKVIIDEGYVHGGQGKKVYLLIFKKQEESDINRNH